jgi:hypothetical protein
MSDETSSRAAAELARKRWAGIPKDSRTAAASKAARARWSGTTQEQRSEIARQRWVTRRKNKPAT